MWASERCSSAGLRPVASAGGTYLLLHSKEAAGGSVRGLQLFQQGAGLQAAASGATVLPSGDVQVSASCMA